MRRLGIWISFLILCGLTSNAQKLVFERIGVENGLPTSEVYNLFQDHKGYIWIFTEYGIVKYNGKVLRSVCKNLPLKESAVYAVAESPAKNMYIANSKGKIFRIFNDKAYPVRGIEKATNQLMTEGYVVYDLFLDDKNGLWFSTHRHTYHFESNKYWVKGFKKEKIIESKKPRFYPKKVVSGEENWMSLVSIVGSNGKVYKKMFPDRSLGSRLIVKGRLKEMYFSVRESVYLNRNGKIKKYQFKSYITSFEIAKNGHVWVGSVNGGLTELDADLNPINHYFGNAVVSDIIFDNQCGIWVSTVGDGVYHCKDIYRKSYSAQPELKRRISLVKKIENKLFFGTYEGKLFYQEGNRLIKTKLMDASGLINDVNQFKDEYFVATSARLIVLGNQFQETKVYENSAVMGIINENDSKLRLVLPRAINVFNGPMLEKENIRTKNLFFTERSPNELFVVRTDGMYLYENEKYIYQPDLEKIKDNELTRVKTDPQKGIWFCTKGEGLFKWDVKNNLTHYDILHSVVINDICFTSSGLIVLATNKGVLVNSISSIEKESSWKKILGGEAMRVLEDEKKIYVGTKAGLSVINEQSLFESRKHPFYLRSIVSNLRRMEPMKTIKLGHSENKLHLNYDFLNYQSADTKLKYQLDGPVNSKDFTESTDIHLQNLVPGEYVLTVSPQMQFQGETLPIIKTRIIIYPAFWQTWAFKILIGAICVAFLFLIFWYFNYRRNKKQQEVAQIEDQLTEYRLTALKSQINPHFMSNSLVAIQRLILEDETDKANQYLAKFSLLLRSLLEYSSKSAALISEELNMIQLYVELEQLRFSHQFVFELKIDPKINTKTMYMPALITQPFVENAIWHGLLPLNGVKEAKLILALEEKLNGIVISIIDNGVGRNKTENKKKHGEFESKGTSLIIQRMENLNRLYNSDGGRVEYIDLIDDDNKSIGTQVNIYLPNEILKQLYEKRNS